MPPVYIPENQRTEDYTHHLDYHKARLADYPHKKGIALSTQAKFDEKVGHHAIGYIKQD